MKTTSLVKVTRQIALPIHLYPASLALDLAEGAAPRATVIAVLARLLLEAAATERSEEAHDEA